MVVQRTINNLKERPKDERTAVAGSIAATVVVILFIAWAIFFFKRIQNGQEVINLSSGSQEEFNFTNVKQAQDALKNIYSDDSQTDELRQMRQDAAADQIGDQQEIEPDTTSSSNVDPFRQQNNGQY